MEDFGGFRIWQTLRNSISLDQSFGFGLKKMKGEAHDCQPLQRRLTAGMYCAGYVRMKANRALR